MQATFGLPLALIVVDTVSAAAGFEDENSASETQKVMTVLQALSRATGALVVPIDHYGKVDETGIRGSSAKSAAADVILACLGIRDKEGNVSNQRLAVAKIRNGAAGRVIPFELRQADGTCIVDWRLDGLVDEGRKAQGALAKNTRDLQTRARKRPHRFRRRSAPIPDGPEVLAVDREKVRNEFMRSYPGRQPKDERRGVAALRKGSRLPRPHRLTVRRRRPNCVLDDPRALRLA